MIIGNKIFDTDNHTYVMGILNVTPDSFSDGGRWNCIDAALKHTEDMIADGVHIIDVGGESTRPGHIQITDEEEIERTAPVIEKIKSNFDMPVSIDSYKSKVAEAAIKAGADLVNDVWGFKYDDKMADLVAKTKVACCLMHNNDTNVYDDPEKDILRQMQECIDLAIKAGVSKDKIMTDPGIGFGKTYEMNLEVLKNVKAFKNLGYPVLLGTSRKSVIGLTLDLPSDEREEGTLATSVYGMLNGCSFVRVHDVKKNIRAVQMTEAFMKQKNWSSL